MTTKEIDIKNNQTIQLPSFLKKGKAFVFEDKNIFIIKKSPVIDYSYVRQKMKKLRNKISQTNINKAIQSIRG